MIFAVLMYFIMGLIVTAAYGPHTEEKLSVFLRLDGLAILLVIYVGSVALWPQLLRSHMREC